MLRKILFVLSCALLATLLLQPEQSDAASGSFGSSRAKRKVLYLTHSAGWKHDVLPLSEEIMKQIGESSGAFEATTTKDCSLAQSRRPQAI